MAAIAPRGGNFRNSLTKGSLTSQATGAVCSERSRAASALSTDAVSSRHSRTTPPPIVGQNEAPSSDCVPETLTDAISVFLRHPTVLEVVVGMVGMGCYRLSHPLTVTDSIGDAPYHTSCQTEDFYSGRLSSRILDPARMVFAQVPVTLQCRVDG